MNELIFCRRLYMREFKKHTLSALFLGWNSIVKHNGRNLMKEDSHLDRFK